MKGLEPPHLAASDPKSDVSTNFTTSGFFGCNFPVKQPGPVRRSQTCSLGAANVGHFG